METKGIEREESRRRGERERERGEGVRYTKWV
jgi:hypothetical protein